MFEYKYGEEQENLDYYILYCIFNLGRKNRNTDEGKRWEMGDGNGWEHGVLGTGYNMGWETITYINIYLVDITKNCKEKSLGFRNVTLKWVNVKKYWTIITLRTINTLKGISINGNFVWIMGMLTVYSNWG